jgi:phosphate transport system permease protein
LGLKELFSTKWAPNVSKPEAGHYGMMLFLVGTLYTTIIAMLLAAPLGIGTAIFIDQVAPRRMSNMMRRGIELLAGIPSVIVGWFGLTLLVPFIARTTGSAGYGVLAASLMLVVMSLPTITTLSAETLRAIPNELKEASAAMGATRWQSIRKIILPAGRDGLIIAVILGMGRAIGEAMAVQMVIGNATQLTFSPLQPTGTITSNLVTNIAEAPPGVFRSALFAQGLVLLIIAMVLIVMIRVISRKRKA